MVISLKYTSDPVTTAWNLFVAFYCTLNKILTPSWGTMPVQVHLVNHVLATLSAFLFKPASAIKPFIGIVPLACSQPKLDSSIGFSWNVTFSLPTTLSPHPDHFLHSLQHITKVFIAWCENHVCSCPDSCPTIWPSARCSVPNSWIEFSKPKDALSFEKSFIVVRGYYYSPSFLTQ